MIKKLAFLLSLGLGLGLVLSGATAPGQAEAGSIFGGKKNAL